VIIDNKYVKIVKNSVLGKYILTGKKRGWEKGCSLDVANNRVGCSEHGFHFKKN